MIKANELRIGNLYDHSGRVKKVTPIVIESLFESERIWCKAIPLTEEWLLKFGFELSHGEWSKKECFEFINNEFYYTAGEGCMMGKPIKYIHQLQNLYFALTNKELTL